ncbi:FtsK/SpoIIIE domain-containing protein [Microbacterium esteraromaticum]|uniref:FtsK/SpoIIIE domain-containing protein n=1 Tax=Microbacterium esteraromaticum TaxID=57043 RepID=UPI002368C609|nr:FtsK/SpoIIIE domain-containing protein [Microbacterium esteraromaticum]WDH79928.1 FtsK/SpoIIIE domain-containing protein [Microbacterium esteraromaticum]
MDATTIVLPSDPAPPRKPSLPLLAAIVPVIAGVVLWLVTGSLFALCFAALGPLMLVASFFDGLRSRGRERKRAQLEADAAWERAEAELERLHLEEHTEVWRSDPDVASAVDEPPLRGHTDLDCDTAVVIGRGQARSRVRATGGDDDRSRSFRERAARLDDAPICVPLGGGICVRAAEPVAAAVVRALVMQLCLRFGPAQLGLTGDGVSRWGLAELPHAGRRRARFRLRLGEDGDRADAMICVRAPGEEPPDGVTTVIDCGVPARARARTPQGSIELVTEALSAQQALALGAGIAARADTEAQVPDRVALDELDTAHQRGLAAIFGRGERGDLVIDLIDDGPHAIVTGMTGTGKSELLISWVAAIAAAHPPEQVAFVLIDFKGGTAFDPLRVLPHVVAVVTDLDADGARRGVGSLSAELRRREAALADSGARDVSECPDLARLVIVVDEFAALLQEHPDLGAVFTDVAARGRALGMHLVLGTQRASGVIRDALAANCPLRMSLRVAESADSRFVIGSDDAAQLPGGTVSRGLAFVRRPSDGEAHAARIALTAPDDLRETTEHWAGHVAPVSPWLPPLPSTLALPASPPADAIVLGLADEPERQRQPWVTLRPGDGLAVIGGPGAGKSSAVAMLAAQSSRVTVIPSDPEQAWDHVERLAEGTAGAAGPVLCDDLDVLVSSYPPDYAQLFLSRWERIVRLPHGAVITLSRVSGPVGRLVDALPKRALLRMTSKVEHIASGGEPDAFDRARPAGRAWWDGREVQLCVPPQSGEGRNEHGGCTGEPPTWRSSANLAGVVTGAVDATRRMLAAAYPDHRVLGLADADALGHPMPGDPASPTILIGDPEEWRAKWALLQNVRTGGELVVAAEHAAELRQLAGARELPSFARMHADRAWAVSAGQRPRRVLLG